jgi:hypothetical protein
MVPSPAPLLANEIGLIVRWGWAINLSAHILPGYEVDAKRIVGKSTLGWSCCDPVVISVTGFAVPL